jgi:hypothetical protein
LSILRSSNVADPGTLGVRSPAIAIRARGGRVGEELVPKHLCSRPDKRVNIIINLGSQPIEVPGFNLCEYVGHTQGHIQSRDLLTTVFVALPVGGERRLPFKPGIGLSFVNNDFGHLHDDGCCHYLQEIVRLLCPIDEVMFPLQYLLCGLIYRHVEILTQMSTHPVRGVLNVCLCLISNTKVDAKVACILGAELLEPKENLAIIALP